MQRAFNRSMRVYGVEASALWDLIHDTSVMTSCSSYVCDVKEEVHGQEWTGTLAAQIARFRLSAPIRVRVVEETPFTQIVIRLSGEDRLLGTRLGVDAQGNVAARSDALDIRLDGSYKVTGRLANLGATAVAKLGDTMIDDFWSNLTTVIQDLRSSDAHTDG